MSRREAEASRLLTRNTLQLFIFENRGSLAPATRARCLSALAILRIPSCERLRELLKNEKFPQLKFSSAKSQLKNKMITFPQNILDFLKEPNFMALGTIRKDGSVQMTIVWFEYENGVFKISTTTPRIKYKNIVSDPRATMLIYDRGNPYRYLQIQGKVSDITKEGAHDFIDKLSGRYTGNAKYKNDPDRKEDRVIISIEPLRYSSVGFAGI